MQDSQSAEYFLKRAAEEREAAERALDERAAQTHRELAKRYKRRDDSPDDIAMEVGQVLPATSAYFPDIGPKKEGCGLGGRIPPREGLTKTRVITSR